MRCRSMYQHACLEPNLARQKCHKGFEVHRISFRLLSNASAHCNCHTFHAADVTWRRQVRLI